MELINRQDAIKALRDTFLGDTYEIDAVACGTIESLKTVEAIPIEWIDQFVDKNRGYISRVTITWLLDDWRAEQRKQNESD